jgi:hypothetical protein
MNARLYDPQIGRFMSADPFIDNIFDSQNLNRYSYVNNNPLSLTDPDGFGFFKKIFKFILAIFVAVILWHVLPIIAHALGIGGVVPGAVPGLLTVGEFSITSTFAVVSGGISGAAAGAITGGGKGALIGAFTGGAFGGIASSGLSVAGKVLASGLVGGIASEAGGGKFYQGFLSAGVAAFAGPFIATKLHIHPIIAHAVAGGLASKLGGGKFVNGAVLGALSYLASRAFEGDRSYKFKVESDTQEVTPEVRERTVKEAFDSLKLKGELDRVGYGKESCGWFRACVVFVNRYRVVSNVGQEYVDSVVDVVTYQINSWQPIAGETTNGLFGSKMTIYAGAALASTVG